MSSILPSLPIFPATLATLVSVPAVSKKSIFEPDFCATKLKDNPWIVQPFEIYEEIRIEEIKKRHKK